MWSAFNTMISKLTSNKKINKDMKTIADMYYLLYSDLRIILVMCVDVHNIHTHTYTHICYICTKLRIQGSCPVRQSPLPKLNLGFDFFTHPIWYICGYPPRWTFLWLSPLGSFIGAPTGNPHKCPWPSLSMAVFMIQVLCTSSFKLGAPTSDHHDTVSYGTDCKQETIHGQQWIGSCCGTPGKQGFLPGCKPSLRSCWSERCASGIPWIFFRRVS